MCCLHVTSVSLCAYMRSIKEIGMVRMNMKERVRLFVGPTVCSTLIIFYFPSPSSHVFLNHFYLHPSSSPFLFYRTTDGQSNLLQDCFPLPCPSYRVPVYSRCVLLALKEYNSTCITANICRTVSYRSFRTKSIRRACERTEKTAHGETVSHTVSAE